MIKPLGLSVVLAIGGLLPAFAGFIEAQPETSPDHQAAVAVAEGGCEIEVLQWRDIVVSLGGSEADAVWSMTEMKNAGELDIDDAAQTIKLKGVLGC